MRRIALSPLFSRPPLSSSGGCHDGPLLPSASRYDNAVGRAMLLIRT